MIFTLAALLQSSTHIISSKVNKQPVTIWIWNAPAKAHVLKGWSPAGGSFWKVVETSGGRT